MIRIEVHGLGNLSEFGTPVFALKDEILKRIGEAGSWMLPEVVVMRCQDFGVDASGAPQQFLRIFCTNTNDFEPLIKALSPLRLAMETVKLEKFYQEKK